MLFRWTDGFNLPPTLCRTDDGATTWVHPGVRIVVSSNRTDFPLLTEGYHLLSELKQRMASKHLKVPILMKQRDGVSDRNRSNQAVNQFAYRFAIPAALTK